MVTILKRHKIYQKENGANIKSIQKRLEYPKLSKTMDTYAHVTDKMKNEAINILENIIADN